MPCHVPLYYLTVRMLIKFRVDRVIFEATANLHAFSFIQMVVK
jgi:hypothetical protein